MSIDLTELFRLNITIHNVSSLDEYEIFVRPRTGAGYGSPVSVILKRGKRREK